MHYYTNEVAQICNGEMRGENILVESVSVDSRNFNLGANTLFIAISGKNHDGHDFIEELYKRGVRAFVVEQELELDRFPKATFIKVNNSIDALQALATRHRERFKGTVVAITGSNGKTVVKEWIADLAPKSVKLFRSPKSYNSQIGVPLSVLMLSGDEDIAVIEAGISQPDEMAVLEKIVKPNIGIITTIGDAHQEGFSTIEQKIEEKLRLFNNSHTIIYNSHYGGIEKSLKRRYGDKTLVDSSANSDGSGQFTDTASKENVATALTLWNTMGCDYKESLENLEKLHPVAMRLELKEGINDSLIINDSYNSDINSLEIALDYLKNTAGSRKQTLILSDILQSGHTDDELYLKVAQLVDNSSVEMVVGIGEKLRTHRELFSTPMKSHLTTESYLNSISREDVANRAILIKGNRWSQFERISHALERRSHTTTIEIDLDAIVHNLNAHRALLNPKTKLMSMVKASGYGHGDSEIATLFQHEGVDYLAVAFADEGVALRESGITIPIVVLNADSDSFELMIANRLEPEIYSITSLRQFIEAVRRYGERDYPIHIKLDTGMHRLGFEESDVPELLDALSKRGNLVTINTIFSHLAASDEPDEDEFTRGQIGQFERVSSAIMDALPYRPLRHIANTAAIERFPDAQFDMVRLGVGLFGVSAIKDISLRPVSTLRSRIVQVKELAPTESVGYGRAGKLRRKSRIATIPVGYADGLNRQLGEGRWSVIINGKKAPTVGRICMDTCMVDVTDIEAKEGDSVVIYGSEEGNRIEDIAKILGTIPYEIMTSTSARVKRIYLKE